MDLLREFELNQIKTVDRPHLKAGDILRVSAKITEGEKTRVQTFEGTVIGVRGSGPSTSFTVRRKTGKFAVERIFQLYSPLITNIEIVKRQKVRRAKLNYLRNEGRRRVKEDELATQRHIQAEENKARLEQEAKKREEEKAAKEAAAARKAELAAQAEKEAAEKPEEKTDEAPKAE